MRSIVCYETQHGSARKLAQTIASRLTAGEGKPCLCVNIDTPFQAEDETDYDSLVLVFGFRGPYTAQLTRLFLQRMAGKLHYKHLILVGEGLFSQKEFPSVAESLRTLAEPATFHTFFMAGQLRVDTLTMEERAILGKFSQLTGMVIEDMGEYSEKTAQEIAAQVAKILENTPVAEDPNAGRKRWICSVCGHVHTGDEPPEQCPVCRQSGEVFKPM